MTLIPPGMANPLTYMDKYMYLPVSGITHQTAEAVSSKFAKGVLASVFLHRYNNPMQMKPKPDPETKPTDLK
jgi:hypothetical protein